MIVFFMFLIILVIHPFVTGTKIMNLDGIFTLLQAGCIRSIKKRELQAVKLNCHRSFLQCIHFFYSPWGFADGDPEGPDLAGFHGETYEFVQ